MPSARLPDVDVKAQFDLGAGGHGIRVGSDAPALRGDSSIQSIGERPSQQVYGRSASLLLLRSLHRRAHPTQRRITEGKPLLHYSSIISSAHRFTQTSSKASFQELDDSNSIFESLMD